MPPVHFPWPALPRRSLQPVLPCSVGLPSADLWIRHFRCRPLHWQSRLLRCRFACRLTRCHISSEIHASCFLCQGGGFFCVLLRSSKIFSSSPCGPMGRCSGLCVDSAGGMPTLSSSLLLYTEPPNHSAVIRIMVAGGLEFHPPEEPLIWLPSQEIF